MSDPGTPFFLTGFVGEAKLNQSLYLVRQGEIHEGHLRRGVLVFAEGEREQTVRKPNLWVSDFSGFPVCTGKPSGFSSSALCKELACE